MIDELTPPHWDALPHSEVPDLVSSLTSMSVHAAEMAILYRRGGAGLDADALRSFSDVMGAAAVFMGKRDAQIELLTELAHQYLSDLRYPPVPDSRDRRIERIEAVLKETADDPR